jgi:transcriptional regulator GlxA family with amidase domain
VPAVDAGLSGRLSGGGPQWVVRVLDLAAAHADEWLVDPVASIAPTLLAHTPARIPDVAERLGVGERHLRRRFAAARPVPPHP